MHPYYRAGFLYVLYIILLKVCAPAFIIPPMDSDVLLPHVQILGTAHIYFFQNNASAGPISFLCYHT